MFPSRGTRAGTNTDALPNPFLEKAAKDLSTSVSVTCPPDSPASGDVFRRSVRALAMHQVTRFRYL
eukprot:CAMPEP_0171216066 /NCGR_PEP_ID=MMETSP0790-20130122/31989_1 /TAXON_ID=2925 /ORGANISM="Alexandrium catenella, Strain OF101" /LENGTH=65 /DNA_ID=CAMNT_0011681835 /DNA_START=168 /DNA_END=362 /DNA_ORIENTATION=-